MLIALPFILLTVTLFCVNIIVSRILSYLTAIFVIPLVLLKIKDMIFKTNDAKSAANLISELKGVK